MANNDSAYLQDILAMRNLLIHEYAYVDADEVWKACEVDVPDLKQKILKITDGN